MKIHRHSEKKVLMVELAQTCHLNSWEAKAREFEASLSYLTFLISAVLKSFQQK